MEPHQVWAALPTAPWGRLGRIHGNCHSSMIGLVTGWWADLCSAHHVLDGAPGYKSRANADAILCDALGSIGVVEVEGTRYCERAETVEHYLNQCDCHEALWGIRFGLLVLYPISVSAKQGETGLFNDNGVGACAQAVRNTTAKLPGAEVFMVIVDKRYEPEVHAVRQISGYHHCTVSRVRAVRFVRGEEVSQRVTLWQLPSGRNRDSIVSG